MDYTNKLIMFDILKTVFQSMIAPACKSNNQSQRQKIDHELQISLVCIMCPRSDKGYSEALSPTHKKKPRKKSRERVNFKIWRQSFLGAMGVLRTHLGPYAPPYTLKLH